MIRTFARIALLAVALVAAPLARAATPTTPYNELRLLAGSAPASCSTSIGTCVNFTSDTIVAIPVSNSYTPNYTVASGQKMISDVTAYEVTTCGGARLTLAAKTWTEGSSPARYMLKSTSPLTWTASGCTLNIKYVVFAKSTGTDSTSPLLFVTNFDDSSGSAQLSATSGGTITLTMDATNGWIYL